MKSPNFSIVLGLILPEAGVYQCVEINVRYCYRVERTSSQAGLAPTYRVCEAEKRRREQSNGGLDRKSRPELSRCAVLSGIVLNIGAR